MFSLKEDKMKSPENIIEEDKEESSHDSMDTTEPVSESDSDSSNCPSMGHGAEE